MRETSAWVYLSQQSQFDELVALLSELIATAHAIDARNKLSEQMHSVTLFIKPELKESSAQVKVRTAGKEGIGCALIISTSNIVQSLTAYKRDNQSKWKLLDVGPLFSGIRWSHLIMTAANYVRHIDEWREALGKARILDYPDWREKLTINNEAEVEGKFSYMSRETRQNIIALFKAGMQPYEYLVDPMSLWKLAERIKLTDLEFTAKCFADLVSAFNQQEN